MTTVVFDDFEWDDDKADRNIKKHGVSFEEAASAVLDPQALVIADDHPEEDRFQVIGCSWRPQVLLVVLVERGERERIISARPATAYEESLYAGIG